MKSTNYKIFILILILIWIPQIFADSIHFPANLTRNLSSADDNLLINGNTDQLTFIKQVQNAEKIYSPIFKNKGRELQLLANWNNEVMNAYTTTLFENNRTINKITMNGGLFRFAGISQDGFSLLICHEIGHHLGGAPKYNSIGATWGTVEGQSDYYATLKCMKKMLKGENHAQFFDKKITDPWTWDQCRSVYLQDEQIAICVRSLIASLEIAQIDQRLNPNFYLPYFRAPDTTVVSDTKDHHLYPQCRLDTYVAGALCNLGDDENLSDYDEKLGACDRNFPKGMRPTCWYKENIPDPYRFLRD